MLVKPLIKGLTTKVIHMIIVNKDVLFLDLKKYLEKDLPRVES